MESLTQQLARVYQDVGWLEETGYGHLLVSGSDAAAWLQRLVSNEMLKLPVGFGRYAALLDRKGMVLSFFYVLRLKEDSYHILSPPPLAEKSINLLKKFKIIERLELKDQANDWALLRVVGDHADPFLEEFFQVASAENQAVSYEGGWIWRESCYQKPVWNILIPKDTREVLIAKLNSAKQVSPAAFQIIRQKSGIPVYGVDVDEQHTLLEANMHCAYVRFKGCYPGQEVVERILAYGEGRTPRTLVTLHLPNEVVLSPGTPLKSSERQVVGQVTSALYDPSSNQTIVMGYVEWKFKDTPLTL